MNATLGPAVVTVDAASGAEEKLELDPARLTAGSPMPEQFVRNAYTDTSGRFFAGIWRSSVGAWRVTYTENELCVLTAGRIRITDDHGRQWTYGPGDSFVMPAEAPHSVHFLVAGQEFVASSEPPWSGTNRVRRQCSVRLAGAWRWGTPAGVHVFSNGTFPAVQEREPHRRGRSF